MGGVPAAAQRSRTSSRRGSTSSCAARSRPRKRARYARLRVSRRRAAIRRRRTSCSVRRCRAFPVESAAAGCVGYFQVDADGAFSTPLLPGDRPMRRGGAIGMQRRAQQVALRDALYAVLPRGARAEPTHCARGARGPRSRSREKPCGLPRARSSGCGGCRALVREAAVADAVAGGGARARRVRPSSRHPSRRPTTRAQGLRRQRSAFDELNAARRRRRSARRRRATSSGRCRTSSSTRRATSAARTARSAKPTRRRTSSNCARTCRRARHARSARRCSRMRRAGRRRSARRERRCRRRRQRAATRAVRTFESELDPFEFGLLDTGHLVLFRNVWRDGQRYDPGRARRACRVRRRGGRRAVPRDRAGAGRDLVVAYRRPTRSRSCAAGRRRIGVERGELAGDAAAPLAAVGAARRLRAHRFASTQLPPAPGTRARAWVAIVLAVVLLGGFVMMYRLRGCAQMRARAPAAGLRVGREPRAQDAADLDPHVWRDAACRLGRRREKRHEYYDYIHDESERLSRLIDERAAARAARTRNEQPLELKPVRVAELMDMRALEGRTRRSSAAGSR